MEAPMSLTSEQASQFENMLIDRFFAFFPEKSGILDENQRRQDKVNRLSKSLAAFALTQIAKIEPNEAATWVIDDHNDNGIDAIYYDENGDFPRIIFIQSKYKVNGEPDLSETIKFAKGVRDFTNQKYQLFNTKLQAKLPILLRNLENSGVKHLIVVTHLGGNLSRHSQQEIDSVVENLKLIRSGCYFENWDARTNYSSLTSEFSSKEISNSLAVKNWILVDDDPKILYGQISILELIRLYSEHNRNLFSKNIRNYVGSSEVNQAIESTIKINPKQLIHLNNGLTILCKKLEVMSGDRQETIVFLKDFSIVNGAQTVGVIGYLSSKINLETNPAKLMVTIIENEASNDDFGGTLTQARNTQNRVRSSDFVSQHSKQEFLRRELAVSGIEYYFKSDEQRPASIDASSVFIEEASIALACLSGELNDAVLAKQNSLELIDVKTNIYRKLFPDSLTGMRLYRKVIIFRFLNGLADETERTSVTPDERIFYKHMRYFIFHLIRRNLYQILDKNEQSISKDDMQILSRAFNNLGEAVRELCSIYEQGYLAISRSNSICQDILKRLEASH
jgi:AIPR protein